MPILGQQGLGGRFDRRGQGYCCLAQARLVRSSILLGVGSPSRPFGVVIYVVVQIKCPLFKEFGRRSRYTCWYTYFGGPPHAMTSARAFSLHHASAKFSPIAFICGKTGRLCSMADG